MKPVSALIFLTTAAVWPGACRSEPAQDRRSPDEALANSVLPGPDWEVESRDVRHGFVVVRLRSPPLGGGPTFRLAVFAQRCDSPCPPIDVAEFRANQARLLDEALAGAPSEVITELTWMRDEAIVEQITVARTPVVRQYLGEPDGRSINLHFADGYTSGMCSAFGSRLEDPMMDAAFEATMEAVSRATVGRVLAAGRASVRWRRPSSSASPAAVP